MSVIYSDVSDAISDKTEVSLELNTKAIEQQIYNVLAVPTYQIPGRPGFATSLHTYLHEFDDVITRSAVETEVYTLLERYVDRITVEEVICEAIRSDEGLIIISIHYIFEQDRVESRLKIKV